MEHLHFDFFYARTSFRMMALFYKTLFKTYFEHFKAQKKQSRPLIDYLVLFTQDNMAGLLESMESRAQICEYLEMLKRLVFCHRYNKNDPYVGCNPTDFDTIREPMYKYSKFA